MKTLSSDELFREDRRNERMMLYETKKAESEARALYVSAAKTVSKLMRYALQKLKTFDKPPAALMLTDEGAKNWRIAKRREALRKDEAIEKSAAALAAVGEALSPLVDTLCKEIWRQNAHDSVLYTPERWKDEFFRAWSKPSTFSDLLRNGFNVLLGGVHALRVFGKRLADMLSSFASKAINVLRGAARRAMNRARMQWIRAANAFGGAEYGKKWLDQRDDRVRDSHAAMHGQVRRINEHFVTGAGNLIMYPGDTEAPIEEWINCRCILRRVRIA